MGMDISLAAGKKLKDNLDVAGCEGEWSIKDMIASFSAWEKTVSSLTADQKEVAAEVKDSLPTLEDVREAVRSMRDGK